jgi:hypothetical protein
MLGFKNDIHIGSLPSGCGIMILSSMQEAVAVSCRRTVAEKGLVSFSSDEELDLSCGMGGILVLQSMVSHVFPLTPPSSQSASSMQDDGEWR